MRNMKKIIIASALISAFGFAQAQPYDRDHRGPHDRMEQRHDRMEQRENRRDVMDLERDAAQQKARIDRAIYTRAITPDEANRVRSGFNRVMVSVDRAKADRRISDREVRRIAETLRKNELDLEMMVRRNHRR